jgi:hypothetical protein
MQLLALALGALPSAPGRAGSKLCCYFVSKLLVVWQRDTWGTSSHSQAPPPTAEASIACDSLKLVFLWQVVP